MRQALNLPPTSEEDSASDVRDNRSVAVDISGPLCVSIILIGTLLFVALKALRPPMCDDTNVLNCFVRVMPASAQFRGLGAAGLFLAPWLLWQVFSRSDVSTARLQHAPAALVFSLRVAAILAGCALALVAFFVYPGFMFCSVFCLGVIGLPVLGITSALATVLFVIAICSNNLRRRGG
jgi:hypothetical protein